MKNPFVKREMQPKLPELELKKIPLNNIKPDNQQVLSIEQGGHDVFEVLIAIQVALVVARKDPGGCIRKGTVGLKHKLLA